MTEEENKAIAIEEVKIGEDFQELQNEQHSWFKVTRNSRGINYEFKIIEDDLEKLQTETSKMNDWAKLQFGEKKVQPGETK
jgi:hypothetical protein